MCGAEYHDPDTGTVVLCERPVHFPSEWHRNRTAGIVWFFDRREQ